MGGHYKKEAQGGLNPRSCRKRPTERREKRRGRGKGIVYDDTGGSG